MNLVRSLCRPLCKESAAENINMQTGLQIIIQFKLPLFIRFFPPFLCDVDVQEHNRLADRRRKTRSQVEEIMRTRTVNYFWGSLFGRVKLEDEAFEFRITMAEIERLSKCIEWIDLSLWSASGLPSGRFKWDYSIILLVCHRDVQVSFSKSWSQLQSCCHS